jgi:hypothetical protein
MNLQRFGVLSVIWLRQSPRNDRRLDAKGKPPQTSYRELGAGGDD